MENFLEKINIILSNPSHPGNIGSVARAMKNMGFSSLSLVNPKEYPSDVSNNLAKGGLDILNKAKIFLTLDQALADYTFILGTSCRDSSIYWPTISLKSAIEKIDLELKNKNSKIAILFGRERTGLLKEEVYKCNYQVFIPANPDYSSLNLSQSVLIFCYELFNYFITDNKKLNLNYDSKIEYAANNGLEKLYEELNKICLDMKYLDPNQPGNLMNHFRKIFKKAKLEKTELDIMLGFLKHIKNNLIQK